MNSKEALIKIEEELYLLLPKGIRQELIETIKQDLDKLEQLEKENKDVVEALDEAISKKANSDDVYTKEEVDNKFSNQELSNY